VISDQIVERIRTAAEEVTGVQSAEPAVQDSSGYHGRGLLFASAACVVMLLVGLVVNAILRRQDVATTSGPPLSSMTVQGDVGEWLDLSVPPDGLRQETNMSLASTVVCTTAAVVEGSLVCTELEGQIETHYLPATAPPDADETENEISIRTIYTDADPSVYFETIGGSSPTQISLRGTDALMARDDQQTTIVWSERPEAILSITTKTGTGHDAVVLAEDLVPRLWPASVRPPMVAVDLAATMSASGNNHPYALATTQNGAECISVGYVPSEATGTNALADSNLACTTSDDQPWAVGTLSDQAIADDPARAERDVFAGLVPNSVTRVDVTLENGQNVSVATVAVPGLQSRAWATPTGAPQGTIAIGTITGYAIDGDESFVEPLIALMPTVFVDVVCSQPGTTGIVPDLVGQDLRAADAALRAAGLIVAYPYSGHRLPIIDGQEPEGGTSRGCGDVTLSFEE
jgi:hypothetical protein